MHIFPAVFAGLKLPVIGQIRCLPVDSDVGRNVALYDHSCYPHAGRCTFEGVLVGPHLFSDRKHFSEVTQKVDDALFGDVFGKVEQFDFHCSIFHTNFQRIPFAVNFDLVFCVMFFAHFLC